MTTQLIGLFPYLYFHEPLELDLVHLAPVIFNEPDNWPIKRADRHHFRNILGLFRDGLGRPIVAATTFSIDVGERNIKDLASQLEQAITILRFSLLNANHKAFSFEQTFFYLFELPPIYESIREEQGISSDYKGILNFQREIYTHQNMVIYPPNLDLRTAQLAGGDLYNIDLMRNNFYYSHFVGLTDFEKERVLISMDWCNQTFQIQPIRDRRGKIVDMATAFEVLLDLPQEGITGAFRSSLQALLGASRELSNWASRFYDTRSKIIHAGIAESLLYKHPEAVNEHLDLLLFARMVFRWCIETMMGEKRGSHVSEIIDLLTPNDVHLKRLKSAGNIRKIKEKGLLEEVSKLIPAYPLGKRENTIWLGKVLLKAFKDQYLSTEKHELPTLSVILDSEDTDIRLGVFYNDFLKEFEAVYFKYIRFINDETDENRPNKVDIVPLDDFERIELEDAIYHFARFASFALLIPPEN